jgi:hypothetical protein
LSTSRSAAPSRWKPITDASLDGVAVSPDAVPTASGLITNTPVATNAVALRRCLLRICAPPWIKPNSKNRLGEKE